jgi:hypothetical protein
VLYGSMAGGLREWSGTRSLSYRPAAPSLTRGWSCSRYSSTRVLVIGGYAVASSRGAGCGLADSIVIVIVIVMGGLRVQGSD